ncbi:hypothetical protein BC834DRAFT_940755 [Gloeopeniophorella convolvens]|nr:hypothetical protein BC834DRAFT_940755 [Gloeopeniophorella convolvens]
MQGGAAGGLSQQQQQQLFQYLRNQIQQGLMTPDQARQRFQQAQANHARSFQDQNVTQPMQAGLPAGSMPANAAQQQIAALAAQRAQAAGNNQLHTMNPLQRAIQSQDPSHARQLNMIMAHNQQPPNGSTFASRVGQNLHPPGMGLPPGQQAPLSQGFVQPSPSVSAAALQTSPTPQTAQNSILGMQQILNNPQGLAQAQPAQLMSIYNQLMRSISDGEKLLTTAAAPTGDADAQRRNLFRVKLDGQRQFALRLQNLIKSKQRPGQGADAVQQTVNGAGLLDATARPSGIFGVERPPQHGSPAIHQATVNTAPPQRSIPTPQQTFAPHAATPQPNLSQMSPHAAATSLPYNGALAQVPGGATPQQALQNRPPSSQPSIQITKFLPLPEDRFKQYFAQFSSTIHLKISERDLMIENRVISLYNLHQAVNARSGYDAVTQNDEWPLIGAALGFTQFGGDGTQPARCGPVIAHRLQQIYNELLRRFDHAYLSNLMTRYKAQIQAQASSGQGPSTQALPQQVQQHQPSEADYQALRASILPNPPHISPETMGLLPRFSHTSGADLEAHHIPHNVIQYLEQHRDNLQRAAQDQNGFRFAISKNQVQPDNRGPLNQAAALQPMGQTPGQVNQQQMHQLQLQRQALAQSTSMFNGVGSLARPPTAQAMGPNIAAMNPQLTSGSSAGSSQSQPGSMPAPVNLNNMVGMNPAAPSAAPGNARMPTAQEEMAVKRWLDEVKRMTSAQSFENIENVNSLSVNDIDDYKRTLERLDHVLKSIENIMPIVFASSSSPPTSKRQEIAMRVFRMMHSTKFQLDELNKPNPRYVLELHTIRGMIQEADNMDKGLRHGLAVLGRQLPPAFPHASGPSAPQPPPSMAAPAFGQPATSAMPNAPAAAPRPPHAAVPPQRHQRKPSQAQTAGAAVSTPTPPPMHAVSTPTPQAATPSITAPSPQTPKSPGKGKAPAKPKPAPRRKSTKANTLDTSASTPATAATPASAPTPADGKGGHKRPHEDEGEGATPGGVSAPSPKRVKSEWEGVPNEEVRKRDEQAESVKTDDQALAFVESVTKFIDENPESAEAASNALDEILRACPPTGDFDDSTLSSFSGFGDLPPASPHHLPANDMMSEFLDLAAWDDTPTPDLVAGSSTNPSPESASDQDHPHTGNAGPSPQISNVKEEDMIRSTTWKEISGAPDPMFHSVPGWKWEGMMDTPEERGPSRQYRRRPHLSRASVLHSSRLIYYSLSPLAPHPLPLAPSASRFSVYRLLTYRIAAAAAPLRPVDILGFRFCAHYFWFSAVPSSPHLAFPFPRTILSCASPAVGSPCPPCAFSPFFSSAALCISTCCVGLLSTPRIHCRCCDEYLNADMCLCIVRT